MEASQVPLVAIAVLGLALAIVQTWRVSRLRSLPGRRARERAKAARTGELDSERVLGDAGYRILARQVPGAMRVRVDGEPLAVGVRADLLVTRRRRRFVAEVKTGALAPRVEHGPTRRQLLEYLLAFEVDGVLLVDPRARTIREITFPDAERAAPARSRWLLAIVWLLGMALAWSVVAHALP